MRKRIIVGVTCIGMMLSLTGCYSQEEIQQRLEESLQEIITSEDMENKQTTTNEEKEEIDTESPLTSEAGEEENDSTENATTETATAETATENQQQVESSQEEQGWRMAYLNKMNEMQASEFGDTVSMFLVDVDQDGIPEMVATSVGESNMYTYSNGELVTLEYQKGYYPCEYHYQDDMLIAVDSGFDVLSGTSINFARKEGNQLIETYYFFHWDENFNPVVYFGDSSGEEVMMDYEAACAVLNAQEIYVSYAMNGNGGYDQCLLYSVTFLPDTFQINRIEGAGRIEEAILSW